MTRWRPSFGLLTENIEGVRTQVYKTWIVPKKLLILVFIGSLVYDAYYIVCLPCISLTCDYVYDKPWAGFIRVSAPYRITGVPTYKIALEFGFLVLVISHLFHTFNISHRHNGKIDVWPPRRSWIWTCSISFTIIQSWCPCLSNLARRHEYWRQMGRPWLWHHGQDIQLQTARRVLW